MDGASSPSCRPSMRNCRRPFNEVGPTPGSFGPFHIPPGPGEPRPALLLSARRSRLACRKQPSRGPGLYSALRPTVTLGLQAKPFSLGCIEDLLA